MPQPLRHHHSCSGCYRLERSSGGTCPHWKAPRYHGAHPLRTLVVHKDFRGRPRFTPLCRVTAANAALLEQDLSVERARPTTDDATTEMDSAAARRCPSRPAISLT